MRDFKKQLASIRPKVPRASTPESRSKTSAVISMSPDDPSRSLCDPRISQLPYLGRVTKYFPVDGHGFISVFSTDLLVHVSNRIPQRPSNVVIDFTGKDIVYAVGASPRKGGRQAIQWCPVDDFQWEARSVPCTQQEWDEVRAEWYAGQDLHWLIDRLSADPRGSGEWDDELRRESERAIVTKSLFRSLASHTPEEWRQRKVSELLRDRRLPFADLWDCDRDEYVPTQLLESFPATLLAVWGSPRYRWVSQVPPVPI